MSASMILGYVVFALIGIAISTLLFADVIQRGAVGGEMDKAMGLA